MSTRFSLRYRNLQIPTHGVLAPVALLITFAILIIFIFLIESINAFHGLARQFHTVHGRFHGQ